MNTKKYKNLWTKRLTKHTNYICFLSKGQRFSQLSKHQMKNYNYNYGTHRNQNDLLWVTITSIIRLIFFIFLYYKLFFQNMLNLYTKLNLPNLKISIAAARFWLLEQLSDGLQSLQHAIWPRNCQKHQHERNH